MQQATRVVDSLREAWASYPPEPDLRAFLGQCEDQSGHQMNELVGADAAERLRRGLPVTLSFYRRILPELGPADLATQTVLTYELMTRHDRHSPEARDRLASLYGSEYEEVIDLVASFHLTFEPSGNEGGADPQRSPHLRIGPYQVEAVLGEGGFGTVYLGRRTTLDVPVAIKSIRPGMASPSTISRFNQEREALSRMSHPAIAQILDAGESDRGMPYFVMEYVPGLPLTRYADEKKLSIEQRLELFATICDGVQHAHAKGIIHRDLTPSNILVREIDGRAVPKIIDFGVAKALDQAGVRRTLVSRPGHAVGTPDYMSPEQAAATPLDVDTRSDVYSLGVLLYEVLVGTLPFVRGPSGFSERSSGVEPPRPSTKLVSMEAFEATQTCMQRRTALHALRRELRRELDWIPIKAIRWDREARYQTAAEMAADIRNYLLGMPLLAGPQSPWYRLQKFAQRHALPVGAAAAAALVLVGALVVVSWALSESHSSELRARAAANTAEVRRAEAEAASRRADAKAGELRQALEQLSITNDFFVNDLMDAFTPSVAQGREVTILDVLRTTSIRARTQLSAAPAVEAVIRQSLGMAFVRLGAPDLAVPEFERAITLREQEFGPNSLEVAQTLRELALTWYTRLELEEAVETMQRAATIRRDKLGAEHPLTLRTEGEVMWMAGYKAGGGLVADILDTEMLKRAKVLCGLDETPEQLRTLISESIIEVEALWREGRRDDARQTIAGIFGRCEHALSIPLLNRTFMSSAIGAGIHLHTRTQYMGAAECVFEYAVETAASEFGERAPMTLMARRAKLAFLTDEERWQEAVSLGEELVAAQLEVLEPSDEEIAWVRRYLAVAAVNIGRAERARELVAEMDAVDPTSPAMQELPLWTRLDVAQALREAGQNDEANALVEQALVLASERPAFGGVGPAGLAKHVSDLLFGWDAPEESAAWHRRAIDLAASELAAALASSQPDRTQAMMLNNHAWCIVAYPGAADHQLAVAHQASEAAIRLDPQPAALNTLAATLFRLGRHAEALQALERAEALGGAPSNEDLIFIALAAHALGQAEKSSHAIRSLYSRVRKEEASPEMQRLMLELESVASPSLVAESPS